MISRLVAYLTAIGLLLLVTLALAVLLLRLAPPLSNAYRTLLAEQLSTHLGYQVKVGATRIDLVGLRPRLCLERVAIRHPKTGEPILEARALDLDLGLTDLLKGRPIQVAGVRLVGGRLVITRGADGRFQWGGLETARGEAGRTLERFLTQGWLELAEGEILITDAGSNTVLSLVDIRGRLTNAGWRHGLDLDARLVAPLPWFGAAEASTQGLNLDDRWLRTISRLLHRSTPHEPPSGPHLHLALRLEGPPGAPLAWQGRGYGRLAGRDLGWLWPRGWLRLGRLQTSEARIETWFALQETRLLDALVQVQVQGLRGSLGDLDALAREVEPSPWDLDALAQIQRLDAGWQVLIQGRKIGPPAAPIADLGAELRLAQDGALREILARATGLGLDTLGGLFASAPWTLPAPLAQFFRLHPQGTLDELDAWVALTGGDSTPRWQFRAHLSNLGIPAQAGRPGFAGLDLWLGGDQDGGWGRLVSQGLDLKPQPILDQALHLERLHGRLDWSRLDQGGWLLTAYQLALDNADLGCQMRLELVWPADADRPNLELSARFQGRPGAPLPPYLPTGLMDPHLVRWLASSIHPGQVTEGRLVFKGPLGDGPGLQAQRRFELDLAFIDVRLDYWPDWPALTAAAGHLRLRDQTLGVWIERARLLDSDLRAQMDLPHLDRVERLPIHVEIEGPFGDGQRFLHAIPLGSRLAETTQALEPGGQARWLLDLDVPLAKGASPAFSGQLIWPGPARLALRGGSIQLIELGGALRFHERGIAPSTVTARLVRASAQQSQPLRLTLATQQSGLAVGVTASALDLDGPSWPKTDTVDLDAFGFKRLDLAVDRLRLAGIPLEAARIEASPTATGWHLNIAANGLAGELNWPVQAEAKAHLRLDRLDLKPLLSPAASESSDPGSSALPRDWPPLAVHIDQVTWGKTPLGTLDLQFQADDLGARCPRLALDAPGLLRIDGQGEWLQGPGGTRSHLALTASSPDPGQLLAALDERSAIASERASAHLDLTWPGGPLAFGWTRALGLLELELGPGRLLRVEPGVGRLLGMIDLGSIGRRLALDFSDLHAPGFAFERLFGRIAIAQGQARFDDLRIEGPAAWIRVMGTTDLISQRLDQRILVEPKLGPGLALASAVAGGPVIGAAVWLVDRATGHPLARLGRYAYRVTGVWDDPRWTRLGWEPLAQRGTGAADKGYMDRQAERTDHFLDHP